MKRSILWIYGVVMIATLRWVVSVFVLGFVGYLIDGQRVHISALIGALIGLTVGGVFWYSTLRRLQSD